MKIMDASVEAVIISDPRRGEIVRLPDEAISKLSDEDLQALNAAMDDLIAAIERVATEVQATVETLCANTGQA
jgi:hypothetical protein